MMKREITYSNEFGSINDDQLLGYLYEGELVPESIVTEEELATGDVSPIFAGHLAHSSSYDFIRWITNDHCVVEAWRVRRGRIYYFEYSLKTA